MPRRVVVRVSLNDDKKSTVRNVALAPLLTACGLTQRLGVSHTGKPRRKTGVWESPAANETQVAQQLAQVLRVLAHPSNVNGANQHIALDHIWIYIDQTPPGVATTSSAVSTPASGAQRPSGHQQTRASRSSTSPRAPR